ncbi:hypothetical protein TRFO_04918 [Tritrichomonas foetus]|uniref:Uncharacterized protein n=1 Tax=Tritrichomonas foetus TaxID=1144522 RepID=A0A1J4KA34_9EUKA|nr:hypothetical protein TRFO_04918 [Tritrichomonas foetus]|eukprot:OHT08305.1 hypothetical protein TRFO_04918 [Tritrichomonas foetus]
MSSVEDIFFVPDSSEDEEISEQEPPTPLKSSPTKNTPLKTSNPPSPYISPSTNLSPSKSTQMINTPSKKVEINYQTNNKSSKPQKSKSSKDFFNYENSNNNNNNNNYNNNNKNNYNNNDNNNNNNDANYNKRDNKNEKLDDDSRSMSSNTFPVDSTSQRKMGNKNSSQSKKRKNNNNNEDDFENVSQIDYSSKIDQLRSLIEENGRNFDLEFENLKRKQDEKLAILKEKNMSREQTASNSYDMEYRNVIWTSTLKYLKRGCFTENLSPLFEQAISDEQYRLEKEIIELRQKYEDELAQYKATLPRMQARKVYRRKKANFDTMDPKEMAKIIYNQFFLDKILEDPDSEANRQIERLMNRIQKESDLLTSPKVVSRFMTSKSSPVKRKRTQQSDYEYQVVPPRIRPTPNRMKTPVMRENDRAIEMVGLHHKATENLQKSVKKTDKYLKKLHENEWFKGIFPHIE